jgi:hypothetical protein
MFANFIKSDNVANFMGSGSSSFPYCRCRSRFINADPSPDPEHWFSRRLSLNNRQIRFEEAFRKKYCVFSFPVRTVNICL